MSVFDEDIIETQLDNINDIYFSHKNVMYSGLKFIHLLDDTLRRCRKRSKGTFVWVYFSVSVIKVYFVKKGIIQYSIYYKPGLYNAYHQNPGDIVTNDYTNDEYKPRFEKYQFHEIAGCDFYDIDNEWLNKFYNIIFNHESI